MPDLGISNLDDVLTDVRRITDACSLPLLVDVDTGFGASAFNVARTVKSMIKFGAAAIHIEDQVGAKRCGHRPGKELVPQAEMVDRDQGRRRREDRPRLRHHGAHRRARRRRPAGGDRPRGRLRRGRRRHDLPRSDHRARDVPALRRRGEGADPRQHHRVRRDAALHGGRASQRRRRHRALSAVGVPRDEQGRARRLRGAAPATARRRRSSTRCRRAPSSTNASATTRTRTSWIGCSRRRNDRSLPIHEREPR